MPWFSVKILKNMVFSGWSCLHCQIVKREYLRVMRLTFLGTSAGMPTTERNVTALALALDDSRSWYLVDCGEGTQHQLLHCRYTLSQLQAIFITHVHGDHIFGLPGLLTSASMQGRTEPLTICGPEGVESFVRHSLACADVQHLPFELCFTRSDKDSFQYQDGSVTVTAHGLSHRVPSFAYRISEQVVSHRLDQEKLDALGIPRGPLWGQLQAGEPVTLEDGRQVVSDEVMGTPPEKRTVIIGGDNDQPELLMDVLADADLLVHEATFTDEVFQKVGPVWMHSTAKKSSPSGRKCSFIKPDSDPFQWPLPVIATGRRQQCGTDSNRS